MDNPVQDAVGNGRVGNLLVPVLHGRDYYDKPPLLDWLVMASYRLFGTRDWAARHGGGTEVEYRPFLQLADVAYEIATLLLLVEDFRVPDLEREHRRWAEIEELTSRLTELAGWTAAFLLSGSPLRL